jgi:hypothetical protein
METPSAPPLKQRIGFYYYPDSFHYRQMDLQVWLPELHRLGAAWLALLAPTERAIPQDFLSGLLDVGIQPVLHFTLNEALNQPFQTPDISTLRLLLHHYARWGVRYVVFYDRPNCRRHWASSAWLQSDLVERFLDMFLPLARLAQDEDLTPVFPPLAPGGDFWDLSFLRLALRGLQRRKATRLLEELVLSAEAWTGDHPLEWGVGGLQRWPEARPYHASAGVQDHLGFHIYEWYLDICQQELGVKLPLLLLRVGQRIMAETSEKPTPPERLAHARQYLEIAQQLTCDSQMENAVPGEVLGGCFWLLTASPSYPCYSQAWFPADAEPLPVVGAFRQWVENSRNPDRASIDTPETKQADVSVENVSIEGPTENSSERPPEIVEEEAAEPVAEASAGGASGIEEQRDSTAQNRIDHYVLLPLYAWGVADWDLSLIQPLLQRSHPTIGFSLVEARLARRVTVVGGPGAISAEALSMLRAAGCQVERLLEDGTLVAT